MSELLTNNLNNNPFFSIKSNQTKVPMDAPICQMQLTVDKIRGVLEIMTITVHQPKSMNPFISITTDTAFLSPGLLFFLDMLLSESSFESSIPSYRQAQCTQRQPQYRRPQPQPKAAPFADEAPKATSTSRHSEAEYAFLGKNSRSSDAEILGVSANANQAQIKKAYNKLALTLHPDKNPDKLARGAFQIVTEASERLLAKAPEKAQEKTAAPKAQPTPSDDNRWDFLPENQRPSAPPAPRPSFADWSASAPKAQPTPSDDNRWDFLPENQRPSAPPAPQPSFADWSASAPQGRPENFDTPRDYGIYQPSAPVAEKSSQSQSKDTDFTPSAPSFGSLEQNMGPAAPGW